MFSSSLIISLSLAYSLVADIGSAVNAMIVRSINTSLLAFYSLFIQEQ